MLDLTKLERAVLKMMLAGEHPLLDILRRQAKWVRVSSREYTGVGFHCDLEVAKEAPVLGVDLEISNVEARVSGLAHGAGFVLFVRDGRLSLLEGFSYDEPWPQGILEFEISYSGPETIFPETNYG